MSKVKIAVLCVAAIPAIWLILFLQYYLPSTRKVQVTGTDVKRTDTAAVDDTITSRDMRLINTRDPIDGETHVYRNEDTRWGWPPYFKFDSGDLAGDAANIMAHQPNATVLITYYGWRIPMMDLYPNATHLEIVDPRYTHIPVFNIAFLLLMFGSAGYLFYRARKWLRGRRLRRGGGAPVPAGAAAATDVAAASANESADPGDGA